MAKAKEHQAQQLHGTLLPFMLDNIPVRGKVLRLPNITEQIKALEHGEDQVARLLAELLAAAVVFTFDLKNKANVTLQVHNHGSHLPLLVAKCNYKGVLRAYAQKSGDVDGDTPAENAESVFVVTVDYGSDSEGVQSIVPIKTGSIGQSVETYFEQSAQLPTYFRVFTGVDGQGRTSAGAVFLQAMPHKEPVSDDDWRRMGIVLSTIRPAEILPGNLSEEDLLRRLFAEDTVRVFDHQPLAFTAQGSRKRMLDALASLGVEECRDILDESGGIITMTDEYSGAEETFTEGDIAEIFGETWIPRVKH